ncbi:permease [Aristophania vespae]|uniref:Permease n=1 Tax=Aristophania vespae TaxID=2697033 RepID=A0A6P1NFU9_9PROT|nr:permease [Aristophania vespae]QHI96153.1 permease [Aristophania vespae]UMM63937.1 hypothetical protein DM15PD_09170 [Aristophania vespae]
MSNVRTFCEGLIERPTPGKTPWCLLILLFVAFFSQTLLQGFSLPEETPRSAIERLLGVDIAPSAPFMHHMMGDHRDMAHGSSSHHIMKEAGPFSSAGWHHHHHGDDSCSLCSLLGHITFAICFFQIAIGTGQLARLSWERPSQPRAPPFTEWRLPPSRAPPLAL